LPSHAGCGIRNKYDSTFQRIVLHPDESGGDLVRELKTAPGTSQPVDPVLANALQQMKAKRFVKKKLQQKVEVEVQITLTP
jgi:hypothetical protein